MYEPHEQIKSKEILEAIQADFCSQNQQSCLEKCDNCIFDQENFDEFEIWVVKHKCFMMELIGIEIKGE